MSILRLIHTDLQDDRTPQQRDAARKALADMWQGAQETLRVWDQTQSKFVEDTEAVHRMLAAGETFRGLEPWQRALLRQAASRSGLLFRSLYVGDWTAAVRALRGLALRLGEASYMDLATTLEVQVSNGLEGELYVPPRFRKKVTVAA